MMRRAGGVGVYPALVGAAYGAGALALDRGVAPWIAVGCVNALAFLVVALLERALPYRARWQRSMGDVTTDLLHLLLSVSVAGEVGRRLALLAGTAGFDGWPHGWPLLAQVAAAILVAELGTYWVHRVQHQGGLLWRVHAVHHSAPRLYFLNSARNHPLDVVLTLIVGIAPLAFFGAGPEVIALVSIVAGVHGALQHSNIDLRLGPLNLVLSAAEVHRWHHSRTLAESNANYGQVLLVWDLVFGTRSVPPGEPPTDVGLVASEVAVGFPTGWLGQFATPLERRWW